MFQDTIKQIIALAQVYLPHPKKVEEEIKKAYQFAAKAHEGQYRQSGEPYITHPVMATFYLMRLHPDLASIQACLLHDVPEDTKVPLKDIEKNFGAEVMKLTAAMKKLGKIKYRGEERTIENLRKMFLAITKDLRIAFIKLCDRLHNMETLSCLPSQEKRERIALETLNIYAPIAARLGIYYIKDLFEDLCFKNLYAKEYQHILDELDQKSRSRNKFISFITKQLQKILQENHIEGRVVGRVKRPYSIFKKLKKKNISSLCELYDILAVRVIVQDKATCYATLGIIHEHFTPLPYRFKDYIAVPKSNNYQSLHTTVVGLGKEMNDQAIEIQIRTQEMDEEAEYGIAAHFIYKEKGSRGPTGSDLAWIKTLENISNTYKDHREFLDSLHTDLFSDRIFVLTPKGDVKDLPAGSTPIDFAYAVHTDIGHRCKGAKVDGVIVPLHYELQSGEMVEIITRKDPQPNRYWLSFIRTIGAKAKIKAWFHEQNREQIVRSGRELLNKQLQRLGHPSLDPDLTLLKEYDGHPLNYEQREHVLETIGTGAVNIITVIRKLFPSSVPAKEGRNLKVAVTSEKPNIIIGGEKDIAYKIASCCHPSPWDPLTGYVTRGRSVSVHRSNCKTLLSLNRKRMVSAVWEQSSKKKLFQSRLLLKVEDKIGVLKDILDVIYKQNANITDISVDRDIKRKTASLIIDLDVNDYELFDRLIATISVLDSVISVDGKLQPS